jgi:predicted Holliday junction resolvase-like endonuclease
MPNTILLIIIAILFTLILIWLAYRIGIRIGISSKELEWQENLLRLRGDIANRQRVGIKGKVTETFAPFLQGFPFNASECKFIGDPIDYIVFEGLDEREIKGIHLVEVKSDTSKLSKHQKQIKNIIDNFDSDKISFHTFDFKTENE